MSVGIATRRGEKKVLDLGLHLSYYPESEALIAKLLPWTGIRQRGREGAGTFVRSMKLS
jgi:hypothetical protein